MVSTQHCRNSLSLWSLQGCCTLTHYMDGERREHTIPGFWSKETGVVAQIWGSTLVLLKRDETEASAAQVCLNNNKEEQPQQHKLYSLDVWAVPVHSMSVAGSGQLQVRQCQRQEAERKPCESHNPCGAAASPPAAPLCVPAPSVPDRGVAHNIIQVHTHTQSQLPPLHTAGVDTGWFLYVFFNSNPIATRPHLDISTCAKRVRTSSPTPARVLDESALIRETERVMIRQQRLYHIHGWRAEVGLCSSGSPRRSFCAPAAAAAAAAAARCAHNATNTPSDGDEMRSHVHLLPGPAPPQTAPKSVSSVWERVQKMWSS